MHSFQRNVGRLIEVRIASPMLDSDGALWVEAIRDLLRQVRGLAVLCVDVRGVNVFSPSNAEAIMAAMRQDNPKVERSGTLLSNSTVLEIQFGRMAREASHQARRAFTDEEELLAWLAPSLSPAENERLTAFLMESSGGAPRTDVGT